MIPTLALVHVRYKLVAGDLLGARELLVRYSQDRSASVTTKAAGTITLRSGGRQRSASLDPIIVRTREQLQALVDEHVPAVKAANPSVLHLSDKARAVLLAAIAQAMRAGYNDSGADPVDWDDDEASTYAEQRSGWVSHLIAGLAAGLLAGGVSAAMADARMGLTANGLITSYERGFFTGVQSQGTVQQSTWHATQDKDTCDLCSERDGTVYPGDPPYWPGDGDFGDAAIVCRGSVNCRCEVEYEIVPADEAANASAAKMLAKYDPDQPRDAEGRFAPEGGDGSGSVGRTPIEPITYGPPPSGTGSVSARDQKSRSLWDSRVPSWAGAEDASAEERSAMKIEVMKAVGARIDAKMSREEIAQSTIGRQAMEDRPDATPGEAIAAYMNDMWASTSGDHAPDAVAFQKAAAEEFGLKDAADPAATYGMAASAEIAKSLDDNRELFRTAARAEYENTQEFFAKEGVSELTLFRGVRFSEDHTPPEMLPAADGPSTLKDITMNPLSSMSASAAVARSFAGWDAPNGFVMSAKVPVSRVFSTSMTGAGCLSELEAIVLGSSKDEWMVWHA
jgi:hypothetical protein